MFSQTNEKALESAIEKSLVGISTEELKVGKLTLNSGAGYAIGLPTDFNM